MSEVNDNGKAFAGIFSAILFVTGLLGPFIMAAAIMCCAPDAKDLPKAAGVVLLGFGLVAEILALTFGIAGKGHMGGRIGMGGALVVLALVLGTIAVKLIGLMMRGEW